MSPLMERKIKQNLILPTEVVAKQIDIINSAHKLFINGVESEIVDKVDLTMQMTLGLPVIVNKVKVFNNQIIVQVETM